MKVNPNSLPLTTDDIITLRGKPVAKKIKELKNFALLSLEEWIYYNLNTKEQEYFLFKNGCLMNWQKKPF
jgi:hypothetical protein